MQRLKNLSNKYQKRLIRPEYANTQATPYAASLHSGYRDADGSLDVLNSNPGGLTRSVDPYTLKNSLVPGTVMVRIPDSEQVVVATGANTAEQPFGLLANFVGGDFDEGFAGDSLQNEVGVWRGSGGATFSLLAPAWDDTGLDAAIAANTTGAAILLYAGTDGRLEINGTPGNRVPVARLIEKVSASRIVVDLLV